MGTQECTLHRNTVHEVTNCTDENNVCKIFPVICSLLLYILCWNIHHFHPILRLLKVPQMVVQCRYTVIAQLAGLQPLAIS